jgi:hypothetical protein
MSCLCSVYVLFKSCLSSVYVLFMFCLNPVYVLIRPFVFLVPQDIYFIWFSTILTLRATWWRLFQSFDLECYLMKVIPVFWPWVLPDEGYSRNASCALNLIATFFLLFLNKWIVTILTIEKVNVHNDIINKHIPHSM